MGKLNPLTRARAVKTAKKRIKSLWEDGIYEPSGHAIEELKRHRLDDNDVQKVIRYGRVTRSGPGLFPDTPRRYVLEGKSVNGKRTVCVVEVNGKLVLVTAYRKREKGHAVKK